MLGLPRQQVVVSEHLAAQAREVLEALGSAEAGRAKGIARVVRWRLVIVGLSAIGIVAFGILSISGPRGYMLGTLACIITLVVSFRGLRRARPTQAGKAAS
jgi:hypothetical protein